MRVWHGITLLELLICFGLIGILLGFSIPLGYSFYQKNQLTIIENELMNAIHYARQKALNSNNTLVLTPLANANDWSAGMMIFVDNPKHQLTDVNQIIHRWHWKQRKLRIVWHGFQSDQYLLFAAELRNAASSGHFDIFLNSFYHSKLVINRLGRVFICRDQLC